MQKPSEQMGLQPMPAAGGAIEKIIPQPTVAEILKAVVEKGVTEANVGAVKEIVALFERVEEKNAEKAFAAAFVKLQSEMRKVKATREVPNKDGSVRYTFAAFEEIMAEVGPKLEEHGFTVSFSTDFDDKRLIKICTLTHVGGHSKQNKFAVRIGHGPPGSTETQADGAASTYAKRFALCDALNILVEKDSDARAEGGPITADQAEELARRVAETNSDKEKFLKFAGAKTFAEIASEKYPILDDHLRKKEQQGK